METVFKEQSQLYNFATMDKTRFEIMKYVNFGTTPGQVKLVFNKCQHLSVSIVLFLKQH